MSNLEEIKAKYPLFYQKPHYWIDAIEVECTKTTILHSAEYYECEKYTLTAELLWRLGRSMQFAPLFKPQEGEKFLKDLEEAVSAGCGYAFTFYCESEVFYYFRPKDYDGFDVIVAKAHIPNASYAYLMERRNLNTAAYTDKLRELGYYV